MTIELEPYQVFLVLVTVLSAVAGMIRIMGSQINKTFSRTLNQRIRKLRKCHAKQLKVKKKSESLSVNSLNLKADMPFRYIARDDYIRGQTVIEASWMQ